MKMDVIFNDSENTRLNIDDIKGVSKFSHDQGLKTITLHTTVGTVPLSYKNKELLEKDYRALHIMKAWDDAPNIMDGIKDESEVKVEDDDDITEKDEKFKDSDDDFDQK